MFHTTFQAQLSSVNLQYTSLKRFLFVKQLGFTSFCPSTSSRPSFPKTSPMLGARLACFAVGQRDRSVDGRDTMRNGSGRALLGGSENAAWTDWKPLEIASVGNRLSSEAPWEIVSGEMETVGNSLWRAILVEGQLRNSFGRLLLELGMQRGRTRGPSGTAQCHHTNVSCKGRSTIQKST